MGYRSLYSGLHGLTITPNMLHIGTQTILLGIKVLSSLASGMNGCYIDYVIINPISIDHTFIIVCVPWNP